MSGEFQGVYTAVVTPFTAKYEIDWDAFDKILEQQVAGGISGVVINGTTGESPAVTAQEKLSLVKRARAVVGKRCRVMAGSGSNNSTQSVELSKLSQDAGADSLLVVTPYYNKPTAAGLHRHFSMISQAVTIPICLYHVPGRTGQFLSVDQIVSLCEDLKIPAIKEASGDLGYFSRVSYRLPQVDVLSGDDATFLASLAVGGKGLISVISNLLPKTTVELYAAQHTGNLEKSIALNKILLPLMDLSMCESNPGPIKALMAIRKVLQNVVRPPLADVTAATYQRLEEAMKNASSLA